MQLFKKGKTSTPYLISTLLEFCPSGKVSSDLKRPCKERRNTIYFILEHQILMWLTYQCADALTYLADPRGQSNGVLTDKQRETVQ